LLHAGYREQFLALSEITKKLKVKKADRLAVFARIAIQPASSAAVIDEVKCTAVRNLPAHAAIASALL
jgi:hypothetical protein